MALEKTNLFPYKKILVLGMIWCSVASAQDGSTNVTSENKNFPLPPVNQSSSSKNLSINNADEFGLTPLMQAVSQQNEAVVSLLLNNNANPDIQDQGGESALHIAARNGNQNIIKQLLKYHADANTKDNEGWTPLMRAVSGQHKNATAAILKATPKIITHNKNGESALSLAVSQQNAPITSLLLNALSLEKEFNDSTTTELNTALAIAERNHQEAIAQRINDVINKKHTVQTQNDDSTSLLVSEAAPQAQFQAPPPPIPSIALIKQPVTQEMALPDIQHLLQNDIASQPISLEEKSIALPSLPWKNGEDTTTINTRYQRIVNLKKGNIIAFEEKYYQTAEDAPSGSFFTENSALAIPPQTTVTTNTGTATSSQEPITIIEAPENSIADVAIPEQAPYQRNGISQALNMPKETAVPPTPAPIVEKKSESTEPRPSYDSFIEQAQKAPHLHGVSEAVLVPDNITPTEQQAQNQTGYSQQQLNQLEGNAASTPQATPKSAPIIRKDFYAISNFPSENEALSYWDRMFAFDAAYQNLTAMPQLDESNSYALIIGPIEKPTQLINLCKTVALNQLQCLDYNKQPLSFTSQTQNNIRNIDDDNQVSQDTASIANEGTANESISNKQYWIELGAFSNKNEAEYYWMFLQEDNPDITPYLPIEMRSVENHSLGEYATAIRAGGYSTLTEAQNICHVLRARNITCFVPEK